MSDGTLAKIAGMLEKKKEGPTDYSVLGGTGFQTDESDEEPLPPTGLTFKQK